MKNKTIIGNVVGLPNPKSNWNQDDESKADYIPNKPPVKKSGEENGVIIGDLRDRTFGDNGKASSGNVASGEYAIAMGKSTTASGTTAVAGGLGAIASGDHTVSMGYYTEASGHYSVAYGYGSKATAEGAFAIGNGAEASGVRALAFGANAKAKYDGDVAIGLRANANGSYSTAIGQEATASGNNAIALGYGANATVPSSVAIGKNAKAKAEDAFAMGNGAESTDTYAIAMGRNAKATGTDAIAMGMNSESNGSQSFAAGNGAKATGASSISLGSGTASDTCSVAIGRKVTSSKYASVAMGSETTASGSCSTAFGEKTTASATDATAMGRNTVASARYTLAVGDGVKTGKINSSDGQLVSGKFNDVDASDNKAVVVGNGSSDTARSNAYTLDWSGNGWFAGNVTVGAGKKELATKEYVDFKAGSLIAEDVIDLRENKNISSVQDIINSGMLDNYKSAINGSPYKYRIIYRTYDGYDASKYYDKSATLLLDASSSDYPIYYSCAQHLIDDCNTQHWTRSGSQIINDEGFVWSDWTDISTSILTSPNGTKFRLTVDDNGALSTVKIASV